MVLSCCVRGCSSKGHRDGVKFFRIPAELHHRHRTDLNVLSKERRRKWLIALEREDLANKKYSVICSHHFITGKPADLTDIAHPDWIPSVNIIHKFTDVVVSANETMENTVPVAKRIKLEHSYAYDDLTNVVPVTEEDPLKLPEASNVTGTIKIEVDEPNLIKTEPLDEIEGDASGFEYFNLPNEEHQQIPPDHQSDKIDEPHATQVVEIKVESETAPVNPDEDPLHIDVFGLDFENVAQDMPESTKKNKSNAQDEGIVDSKSFQRLQKERDNLQKTVKRLRAELKETKAREKALQTELGARRMSELSLTESNKALNIFLQECKTKEEANQKQIHHLTANLIRIEKENQSRNDLSEQTRVDLTAKLVAAKAELKKKEQEHRNLDVKCAKISQSFTLLAAKFEQQKAEVVPLKKKLQATENVQTSTIQMVQASKNRIAELNKELALMRQSKEELQKSLLAEKKMSRFFIKERDQLLEEQEARFKEADKELEKMKHSVVPLTTALKLKIVECKAQREATRVAMVNYQKKSSELKAKMEELEKKQEEFSNKQCEYCGF